MKQKFSTILDHLPADVMLREEEKSLFLSVMKWTTVKRRQFIDQPGFVSKNRSFIVKGAFRGFLVGVDGKEHTISLAIDGGWAGDASSFNLQEPSTLFIEAMEDSTLIQWNYKDEQMLLKNIPKLTSFMMQKAQEIAANIQKRVIAHLSLSAEQRYDECMQKHPEYMNRFPLYIIASYLGMTREFLSKIRNNKLDFQ